VLGLKVFTVEFGYILMIKQKNSKDCMQCCLSELLNIPYEEIPEFYKMYNKYSDNYLEPLDDWLSSLGYVRMLIDVSIDENVVQLPFYYSKNKFKCMGILRKENRKYDHAVIVYYKNGQIGIDDPKINTDYSIKDLVQLEFIFRMGTVR
jgi:hypothetical protein